MLRLKGSSTAESYFFFIRCILASDTDRRARVDDLLGVLGLESCADVRVGNPLERGISGGQARRLSVGVGVVDLESVRLLLLDEPTTVINTHGVEQLITQLEELGFEFRVMLFF